jgi:hypothetical protein
VVADAPGTQREHSPAGLNASPVPWTVVSTAVALLAREQMCPEASREDILGTCSPAEVLPAMEVLAAALLTALYPGDRGARLLRSLGLTAARAGVP